MQNISNIIEEFILKQLDNDSELNLSRNDLAEYFGCAPSQINYVLSTRFTYPRGFITESRRGGGGYIKLTRLDTKNNEYIAHIINETLSGGIDYYASVQLLQNLIDQQFITKHEGELLSVAITDKSLVSPINNENMVRANIIKNVLIKLLKEE